MALLTRPRSRASADRASEAAAEAIERARDVAAPTVERAREAAAPTVEWAREATAPTVERAREAAAPTVERARAASRPALARLQSTIGTVLRMAVRVAALLPGFGARILETVATLMGRLADTSAQIAHVEPPSKVGRRRAGLWFVGGFVTGAAAGYAAHELLAPDREDDHVHDGQRPWVATPEERDATSSAQVPG